MIVLRYNKNPTYACTNANIEELKLKKIYFCSSNVAIFQCIFTLFHVEHLIKIMTKFLMFHVEHKLIF